MALMEIILKEKIAGLGSEGDLVKTKAGFARNYLLVQNKALEASSENFRQIESLKRKREEREEAELKTATELAQKIERTQLIFFLKTSTKGKSFGSVSIADLHRELEKEGIEIERKNIRLSSPIKKTGKQSVQIQLHPKLTIELNFTVEIEKESSEE